jgi:hypothetical protein
MTTNNSEKTVTLRVVGNGQDCPHCGREFANVGVLLEHQRAVMEQLAGQVEHTGALRMLAEMRTLEADQHRKAWKLAFFALALVVIWAMVAI